MMLGFGLLLLLLFVGLLVTLLQEDDGLLSKTGDVDLFGRKQQPTARQVLDERLARGEISPEEYEKIRSRIEQ